MDPASVAGPGLPGAGPAACQAGADADLEALLAGGGRLVQSDPAWQSVAEVLAALTAPPEGAELSAGPSALAEFRALPRRRGRLGGVRPGRRPVLTMLRSAGPATAVAASAAALGGLAAVAYAGDLPAPVQRLAHVTIGAPSGTAPRHGQTGGRMPGAGVASATAAQGGAGHRHHRAGRASRAQASRPAAGDSASAWRTTRRPPRGSHGPGASQGRDGTQPPGDPRPGSSQPSGSPQPSGSSQPPGSSQPSAGSQPSASPQPSGSAPPTGGPQPGAKPSPSPQPDSQPTRGPGGDSRPAVAPPP